MFEFMNDLGTYEDRIVDRDDFAWGFISTAAVSDGAHPYETAVKSDQYAPPHDLENTGNMIIVEAYDTTEAAQMGHNRWRLLMGGDHAPDTLYDCANSMIGQMQEMMNEEPITEIRIKPKEKIL